MLFKRVRAKSCIVGMGLSPVEARGSLRMSLGKYNTDEEIDFVIETLPKIVEKLRAMSPLAPQKKTR